MSTTLPAGKLAETPAGPERPHPPRRWIDTALVALAVLLAVVARRPGYLFSHPFWLDEAWVADSVRAPFHQLRLLSPPTPIGWTLLLRLVPPIGPPERLRALPLAFGVLSVVVAYLLGRQLGRVTAVAAGLAAALAPSALRNHNLKQYSADAFVTLMLLWLTARLEAGWSRRRLTALGLACVPAVLVSHVTVFVSAAVLSALLVRAVVARRWERLGWLVAVGLGVAVIETAVYLAFAAAGNNAAMQRFWDSSFVPLDQGLGPAVAFVGRGWTGALDRVGFGPWPLAAALVIAGLVALVRARLAAVALAVCLLASELVVAAAAHRYPFLEQRTSIFLTTLLTVCGGIGVGSAVAWSARRRATLPLGIAAALGAGVLLLPAARASALHPMPPSTLRQQVTYVLDHRRPGDTVVVGPAASFAFAYYWPQRPTFVRTALPTGVLFQPEYPGHADLLLVHQRGRPGLVHDAFRQAAARSSSGRVWVILAEAGDRDAIWRQAAARAGRVARRQLPKLVLVTADADADGATAAARSP
jgi:hypothetical protein